MFITPEQAKKLVNVELPADLIYRAQNIVESYVGKLESEIKSSKDRLIMARATAYQAAYMKDNESIVYEQIATATTAQNDSIINFKSGDFTAPWIAPMAVIVCKNLTFKKSRTVKTGRIFQRVTVPGWRNR